MNEAINPTLVPDLADLHDDQLSVLILASSVAPHCAISA